MYSSAHLERVQTEMGHKGKGGGGERRGAAFTGDLAVAFGIAAAAFGVSTCKEDRFATPGKLCNLAHRIPPAIALRQRGLTSEDEAEERTMNFKSIPGIGKEA